MNPKTAVIIDDHDMMSRREKEVFDLVQRGAGNRQIAEKLGISERTVENKLTMMYNKLGVRNRQGLKNPWAGLSRDRQGEYIADCDREAIRKIRPGAGRNFQLRLDLFPEPYTGDPRAKIILLNLNPGTSGDPAEDKKDMKKLQPYAEKNIIHQTQDYPFYPLNPKLQSTGAYRYWTKILEHPIQDAGAERVAKNVCCIEYFPYHSLQYRVNDRIPSQDYSRLLVENAIRRGALIIIARKRRVLMEQIPALAVHKAAGKVLFTNSCANIKITRKNLPGYDKVIDILLNVKKTTAKE
jgi:DNA-binding CsgD family transcriptional regulator